MHIGSVYDQSLDHRQLAARELVLEKPVAQVDRQVDAVHPVDAKRVSVLLHEHSHKLVANFWRVLCRI